MPIAAIRDQADRDLLDLMENLVRTHRPDRWESYSDVTTYKTAYGHAPDATYQPRPADGLTANQRKLRICGVLLGTNFTTNYATTRSAVQTAVGNL